MVPVQVHHGTYESGELPDARKHFNISCGSSSEFPAIFVVPSADPDLQDPAHPKPQTPVAAVAPVGLRLPLRPRGLWAPLGREAVGTRNGRRRLGVAWPQTAWAGIQIGKSLDITLSQDMFADAQSQGQRLGVGTVGYSTFAIETAELCYSSSREACRPKWLKPNKNRASLPEGVQRTPKSCTLTNLLKLSLRS